MATITRYGHPQEVRPLDEAMGRLFRETFTRPRFVGEGYRPATGFCPSSNLYETKESYILQVALPGVKVEELEITAHEHELIMHGTTKVMVPEKAQGIWVCMPEGAFREEITLPGEVATEKASAEYHDGIVTLVLPKAEHAKVKTIKVGAVPPPAGEGTKT